MTSARDVARRMRENDASRAAFVGAWMSFVPALDVTAPLEARVDAVRDAARRHGFLRVSVRALERRGGAFERLGEMIDEAFAVSEQFFARDLSAKERCATGAHGRGYTSMAAETLDASGSSCGDTKEGFYVSREMTDADAADDAWPKDEAGTVFRETSVRYYKAMVSLGRELLGLFALALGREREFFHEHFADDAHKCVLRFLRYAPVRSSEGEGRFACGAHSDYGCLTILATDSCPGLEIFDRETGSWVPVTPRPDELLVNIGDCLQRWSNNKLRSTRHRVMTAGDRVRYSIPFFFEPSMDTLCEPVCDEGETPEFAPILFSDFLKAKYEETYGS